MTTEEIQAILYKYTPQYIEKTCGGMPLEAIDNSHDHWRVIQGECHQPAVPGHICVVNQNGVISTWLFHGAYSMYLDQIMAIICRLESHHFSVAKKPRLSLIEVD